MQTYRPTVHAVLFLLLAVLAPSVRADSVDRMVVERMMREHVPGITLLVAGRGRILKAKGYGFAQLENAVPASAETAYELASVSKQFTATAILMLAREGRLSLEDPISRFIEHLPEKWSRIRIRHLLNHTSGLIDIWFDPSRLSSAPMLKYSAADQMKDLMSKPLLFEPGTRHEYSSAGYFVLGQIVARVTGNPYYRFITERILKPCGMTHTQFRDSTAVVPHRAQGYTWRNGKWARFSYSDLLASVPDDAYGGLVSTAGDLLKWHRALLEDRLLPQQVLQSMWSPTLLIDGKPARSTLSMAGFGWFFLTVGGVRVVHHGGIAGTMILRAPDRDLVVILLSNLGEGFQPPYGNDHGWDYERLGLDIMKTYLRRR